MNDFDKATHAAEIQATRVGGLGGSDADIMLRVGIHGLSALTNTDLKRLAVMTGQAAQEEWGGNVYTRAGHLFEDYVARTIDANRENLLTADLATNFKTFAHADFVNGNGVVFECKFVGEKETERVLKKYYAQLQYYYLLGAFGVKLVHGTGNVEPFEVEEVGVCDVPRDERTISAIAAGIKLLDEFVTDFVYHDTQEQAAALNDELQQAVSELISAKANIDHYTRVYDAARAQVEAYMNERQLNTIDAGTHIVSLSKATTSRTFDAKGFLKAHPEFDADEFYKVSNKKGSFSVKENKQE